MIKELNKPLALFEQMEVMMDCKMALKSAWHLNFFKKPLYIIEISFNLAEISWFLTFYLVYCSLLPNLLWLLFQLFPPLFFSLFYLFIIIIIFANWIGYSLTSICKMQHPSPYNANKLPKSLNQKWQIPSRQTAFHLLTPFPLLMEYESWHTI